MFSSIRKSQYCVRGYNSDVVCCQDGLSISPAEMNQLNSRNIPISAAVIADELLSPGHKGSDPTVPILRQRGVDFSDVYVAELASRDKIENVIKSSPDTTTE